MTTKARQFESYRAAQAHQLAEWVAGRPWHNPYSPDGEYGETKRDGECCPDFSCCTGNMVSLKAREAFANADGENRMALLCGFLCETVEAHTNTEVYVSGGPKGGDA